MLSEFGLFCYSIMLPLFTIAAYRVGRREGEGNLQKFSLPSFKKAEKTEVLDSMLEKINSYSGGDDK